MVGGAAYAKPGEENYPFRNHFGQCPRILYFFGRSSSFHHPTIPNLFRFLFLAPFCTVSTFLLSGKAPLLIFVIFTGDARYSQIPPYRGTSLIFFLVNGLESLIKRDLLRTSQIDPDLTRCGLGIDANHYLRQLYRRDAIKESLSAALGGIPLAFKSEVEKDLAKFKKFETRVMFVFDGLDLYNFSSKDDKTVKPDPFYTKRKSAWDSWTKLAEKGRYASAEDREALTKQVREAFEAGILFLPSQN